MTPRSGDPGHGANCSVGGTHDNPVIPCWRWQITQGPGDIPGPTVAFDRGTPCGDAQRFPLCRIQGKTLNCLGQFFDVAWSHQPSRPVMFKYFCQLFQAAGHDALAHRHIFKKLRRGAKKPAAVWHGDVR